MAEQVEAKAQTVRVRVLPEMHWSESTRRASLDSMYAHYVGHAREMILDFEKRREGARKMARRLRSFAIWLGGAAALAPAFGIFLGDQALPITPTWSLTSSALTILGGIFLGGAGILVAYDRFFGYSRTWMRSTLAESRLRNLLQKFQFEWESEQAAWAAPEPTPEEMKKALERMRLFIGNVSKVLQSETDDWIKQFGDSVARHDAQFEPDDKHAPPQA